MHILMTLAVVGVLGTCTSATQAAADIKVFSTTALTSVLQELAPRFERITGHKLSLTFATAAVTKRIADGESVDVAVLTPGAIAELTTRGKILPGSAVALASSGIGVAVRAGAPKPDISSPGALKRALLAAKPVAYSDPASGGASGVHFAKVLGRLGIATEIAAKARLSQGGSGGLVGDLIVRGDAEIGVQQIPELMTVSGIDIVGPLPGELQNFTRFSAGISMNAKEPEAGKALIGFLRTPASLALFKAKGVGARLIRDRALDHSLRLTGEARAAHGTAIMGSYSHSSACRAAVSYWASRSCGIVLAREVPTAPTAGMPGNL
jgi:molybdate transport system substrate-binding protein